MIKIENGVCRIENEDDGIAYGKKEKKRRDERLGRGTHDGMMMMIIIIIM